MKTDSRFRARVVEALIGLGLAGLAVFVSWAASGDIPFVYRGL